jgi:nitrite reductase (NO-forming)
MKKRIQFVAFVLLATACQAKAPRGGGTPPPPPTMAASASPGESPAAADTAAAPIDPAAPPRSTQRLRRIRIEISNVTVRIATGVNYNAWTFDGRVPGPILRATVGDTVDFTLVNKGTIPHSMDFHAGELAPSKYFVNVNPNDSLHYRFVPRVPGAFLYHCVTEPHAAHVANGMYGGFIVDPITPRPAAKEFVLVQSDFYLTADTVGKARSLAWDRLLDFAPDYVVFNGRASQYNDHPIRVAPHELVRLYVVNAGPNHLSSFHVVGGIFDRVFVDGSQRNPLEDVQTVVVPVGGGSIFELRLNGPGDYTFLTHSFSDVAKGASGVLRAAP